MAASTAPPADVEPSPMSEKIARPAVPRLVAIGDLHGDFDATRHALRLAGAIDKTDAWAGGALTVVQTGDEIDRGDGDRRVVDYLEKLRAEARKAGGELVLMNGNHELMNTQLDFRYVTDGAFAAFADVTPANPTIAQLAGNFPASARGRVAAFAPGGPYAQLYADRPIVFRVGDTVFAHGGILPKHVTYGLDRMNDEVGAWFAGRKPRPPSVVVAEDGPVWTREYSQTPGSGDCADLGRALGLLRAKRMVVGHTVQDHGITSACGDRVWRIDVGMSKFFGHDARVLQIEGDAVKVLSDP